MQAIILAAGMGKRLGDLTYENTKCMVKVNGVTLIDRLLSQLSKLNLQRTILVIGYKGDKLRDYVGKEYNGMKIEYVYNPIYDKTNNIYSLFLAKEHLMADDTLLIESDIIFEDGIIDSLMENSLPNLALVAKYESWMDGTCMRIDEDNNIVDFITKKTFTYADVQYYYKTVNIYKFSKDFSINTYVPFLEAYSKALGNNEYYEQVLRVITFLDNCDLKVLPLSGEKWYEIDDIQDLDIAETLFSNSNDILKKYEMRYGGYWKFPKLLDFCYLVNPYFPPRKMIDEIKANFDSLLTSYPSGMDVERLLVAKYFGIKHEYICVGNGAAELIKSLMDKIEGNLGLVYPTFEEYPNRRNSNKIVKYIPNNSDFFYGVEDIKAFYKDKNISTILLINPDNPSGNYIKISDLIKLIDWAKNKNIDVVIDESFADFSDEYPDNSLLDNKILQLFPNLIVIKSISKSYGVPGLRLGIIATSKKDLLTNIKNDMTIWNINSFAEFYLQIYSKYENDYKKSHIKFTEERTRFFSKLNKIPYLRVIPSQANYFLCEVINKFNSFELATDLLNDYNIYIKDCSRKYSFKGKSFIRIAIRDKNDNDLLISALKHFKIKENEGKNRLLIEA